MDNALTNLVASNLLLATIMPVILQKITQRLTDNTAKKNVAWAVCLAATVLMAASQGVFNPIVDAFTSSRGVGLSGVLRGAWATLSPLGAAFTVLVAANGAMYDKFWKPTLDAATGGDSGGRAERVLKETLTNQRKELEKTVKAALISEMSRGLMDNIQAPPPPVKTPTAPIIYPAPVAANSLQEIDGSAFDLEEGAPSLDPEETH